ncbi:MAG: hypothetical protein AVDCRST_MAG93-7804, partial [uncultured Chloroflexia bacterium]
EPAHVGRGARQPGCAQTESPSKAPGVLIHFRSGSQYDGRSGYV